jgi:hypothetical protein
MDALLLPVLKQYPCSICKKIDTRVYLHLFLYLVAQEFRVGRIGCMT